MEHVRAALASLAAAESANGDYLNTAEAATVNALQAIAYGLLAVAEQLGCIDDALRNTIGGVPR